MRKISGKVTNIIAAAMMAASLSAMVVLSRPASGQDRGQEAGSQATYRDIEQTLGIVPTFFKLFPESGIAGAWAEFKTIQLNSKTKLDGKTKELIGLAVAAQIPCHYCVYFHTSAAKANGASEEEIREAVAMAAISRHWSTVLNGMQADYDTFRKETDTVLKMASDKSRTSGKSQ